MDIYYRYEKLWAEGNYFSCEIVIEKFFSET